jgi:hypothetical protein
VRRYLKRAARRIPAEAYERLLAHRLWRDVEPEFSPAVRCGSREAVWSAGIAEMGAEAPVRCLEFGVFEGYSTRYFAQHLRHPATRITGFDSFEGLPERWTSYEPGKFSTRGQVPQIADARVDFVKGWFQDSVPPFLEAEFGRDAPPGTCFVHFDADLYSSTLFLLSSLWHYLPAYYFCFDEFMGHELRAWCNFRQAFPVRARFLAYDLQDGFPCRVFGFLERSPAQTR